jgi:uncharacterized protein (DUF433 family)
MQTPCIELYTTQPAYSITPPSGMLSTSQEASGLPPSQQIGISLLALPVELLVAIMQFINNSTDILMLTSTCRQLHIISHVHQTHERQYHILMHNLTIPTLRASLYTKLINTPSSKISLPDPHKKAWQKLQSHSLNTVPASKLVSKIYIDAWEYLLRPSVLRDRANAARLIKILLDLSVHIHNAQEYGAKLFFPVLPQLVFNQLADIHLDWSVQLLARHFPYCKSEDIYRFIHERYSLGDQFFIRNEQYIYISVISYALKRLYNASSHTAESTHLMKLLNQVFHQYEVCELGNEAKNESLLKIWEIAHLYNQISYRQKRGDEPLNKIVRWLLKQGANCNTTDQEGRTLLIHACRFKQEDLIRILLKQPQIDVNKKDKHGMCALHYAIADKNISAVEILLRNVTTDVNIQDQQGKSALHYTIIYNTVVIFNNLLHYPTLTLETQLLALNYAVEKKHEQIIKAFLTPKNKKEEKREFIKQALVLATPENRLAMRKLLKKY